MGSARATAVRGAFIVLSAVASGCGGIDTPSKAADAIHDLVPGMRAVRCASGSSQRWSCTGRLRGRYQQCDVARGTSARGAVFCEPAAYVWTGGDSVARCRPAGTKRYTTARLRARRMPCTAARAMARDYASTGAGGRRSGRADIGGYRCRARRLRRLPLAMEVSCSPAAVPARGIPASRVAFIVRDR